MIEVLDVAFKIGAGMNRSDLIHAAVLKKLKRLLVFEEMKKRKKIELI